MSDQTIVLTEAQIRDEWNRSRTEDAETLTKAWNHLSPGPRQRYWTFARKSRGRLKVDPSDAVGAHY